MGEKRQQQLVRVTGYIPVNVRNGARRLMFRLGKLESEFVREQYEAGIVKLLEEDRAVNEGLTTKSIYDG